MNAKKILLGIMFILFAKLSFAAWISIQSFNVDTSNNKIKVNYKIEENVGFWHINKQFYYYNSTLDTLYIVVLRRINSFNIGITSTIDSSIEIIPQNFNSLCYLNFYNGADTNTIDSTYFIEPDGYILDTATYNFNHCSPLGIKTNSSKSKSLLYPNPSNNYIYIKTTSIIDLKNITIINSLGQKILVPLSKSNEGYRLAIENLSIGKYVVQLTTDSGVEHLSFLKQ